MIELEEYGMRQHAEGQREHAEEDTRVAHREPAQRQRRGEPGERGAHEHDLKFLDAPYAGDDGGGVGADAQEQRVAEGEKTGVAEEKVETQEGDGIAIERDEQGGVKGR